MIRRAGRPAAESPLGVLVVVDAHVREDDHRRVRVELHQQGPALRADRMRRVGAELVAAAETGRGDRLMVEVQHGSAEEVILAGEHLEVHLDGLLREVRRRRHGEEQVRHAAAAVGLRRLASAIDDALRDPEFVHGRWPPSLCRLAMPSTS